MADRQSKKAWDKKQMVFTGFKMFRANGDRKNDQDLIDFLDSQNSKGETIKQALREYMERHKDT